jgi:hypothetical protein
MHRVYRYVLPTSPVASATVHIGRVGIRIGLALRGLLVSGTIKSMSGNEVAITELEFFEET